MALAIIYINLIKCSPVDLGSYSTFELFCFVINSKSPIVCALIYRPPKRVAGFLEEFSEFLSIIMVKYNSVILTGDYNTRICCPSSTFITDFIDLYEAFNLTQHVNGPTHKLGHTLDLVLTHGVSLDNLDIVEFPPSDHKAIFLHTMLPPPDPLPRTSSRSRTFNSNSSLHFHQAFPATSVNSSLLPPQSVDVLVEDFNSTCSHILDSIAPFKTKYTKPKAMLWLNDHTRDIKRQCRKAERNWKKHRLSSTLDHLKELMLSYQSAVKDARSAYFSNLITSHSHNSKILFNAIDSVISPMPSQPLEATPEKCEEFLHHFISKVDGIRQNIPTVPRAPENSPPLFARLTTFQPIPLTTLQETILHMKSSTCALDSIPTSFLKEVLDTVGPSILDILNCSLATGVFPNSLKSALVQPLLKKPSLDPLILNHYRPISKLVFI